MKMILFFALSAWSVNALPTHCFICPHSIDDYAGNGGGADNLETAVREATDYGRIGEATIHSKFPSSYVENSLAPKNIQCQKYTFTPQFHFTCTFNHYGGHSNEYYIFLGNKAGYGKVYPSDMRFGENTIYPHLNARWFHTRSCKLFWQSRGGTNSTNVSYWSPAFKGLHTMLAYASLSYDVSTTDQPAKDFWDRWVNRSESIWIAYSESEGLHGYNNLNGVRGIEVGCLSATRPSGGNYCDLSYGDETNEAAPHGATYYVSKKFGQPTY